MGASCRNKGQIIELAGNDLLTISPQLLDELDSSEGALERKLDPIQAKGMQVSKIGVDKATFDEMHNANRMASEKLKEGIRNCGKAFDGVEQLLKRHLVELKAHTDI